MIERSRKAHQSTERAMRPRQTILKRFIEDVRGAIFIPMVIFFLFLMGIAGLILDVGRIYVMNTAAQAYVDQIALAAAQELDGYPDAIQRARLAAYGETENSPTHKENVLKKLYPFAGYDDLVDLTEIFFFKELPDDTGYQYYIEDILAHSPAGGGANITNDGTEAAFVAVISRATGVWTSLLRIVRWGGGADAAPDVFVTASVAVATLNQAICDNPMLMICNPYEGAEGGINNLSAGQQILLKQKKYADSTWAPGAFGTIDLDIAPPGSCPDIGANAVPRQVCQIGVYVPRRNCLAGSTVDIDPGESIPVAEGVNLRFDIWGTHSAKLRERTYTTEEGDTRLLYPPDALVTKGISNGQAPGFGNVSNGNGNGNNNNNNNGNGGNTPPECKANGASKNWEDAASIRMPRDPCLKTNPDTCTIDRIGEGVDLDDLRNYLVTNYGYDGVGRPNLANIPAEYADDPEFTAEVNTRYKAYLWALELEQYNNMFDAGVGLEDSTLASSTLPPSAPDPANANEYAVPVCAPWDAEGFANPTNPGLKNRRRITVASVDCTTLGVGGNDTNVQVSGLIEMFLTEPALNNDLEPSSDNIYAEVIRVHTMGLTGLLHQFPHLVR